MFSLFPDQTEFEEGIRAAYAGGAESVLGVAPTGFGKTVVFSDIAARAQAKGKRVGIYAHRAELIDQIGRALSEFGVPHGYLAPGYSADPMQPVQVCSIMAAARRVDRLIRNPFDMVILDEAHHAAAGSSAHAVLNAHKGKRKLGVTATPIRLSGEPLSIAFNKMVLGPSMAELIRMGRLTPYRLYAPSMPDLSGVTRRGGDLDRGQAETVMDKPKITGDAVDHYRRISPGRRAVVFCVSIAHAEHVAEQFRADGWQAASLDGKMDRNERRRVIADFSAGRIQVLTSCDIVSEGFDLPAIEVAILLRPTESLALYLQQVGRALRLFRGKEYAIILDHAGNSLDKSQGGRGHGFPDDPRTWSLDGAGASKGAAGTRTIPTIVCGSCWRSFRAHEGCCPYCGHQRDIQGRQISQIVGDLIEVDPDLVRQARREEQDRLNERVRKTRGLLELARLAVELGRNEGWVHNTHKHRGHPDTPFSAAVKAMKKAKAEVEVERT